MSDITRRKFMEYVMASGATLMLPQVAFGADWPTRPITGVIGYSAGGGTDTIARGISGGMESFIGGTVNCINQPGATGSIATDFVWKKPSDGYWLLFVSNYNKFLRVTKKHDTVPWKDWQFYRLSSTTMSFAVTPDSPIKTFGDFLDMAKKNPGKVSIGNSGVGGTWHIGALLLERAAGIKLHHIAYKGGKKATLAALQGEVNVAGTGIHEQISAIKAGKLRNLCVFDANPMKLGGFEFDPITKYLPEAKDDCPYGGGTTPALKRDTDPGVLKKFAKAFEKAQDDKNYSQILAKKGINKLFRIGADADKDCARNEVVTATLLYESGVGKAHPQKDLGLPKLEDFNTWWPPKGYEPRL